MKTDKRKGPWIGLDVGKDSIKMVELALEGKSIKLKKMDWVKLPPSSSDILEQNEAVKKSVAELFAKNNIKNRNIVLGINGESVFIKFLDVLPVNNEKIERTIKYETQQQIPFSLDEVEWDSYLFDIPQKEKFSPSRVLLVAIKKDNLNSKVNLIKEIGYSAEIADISSLAIYNCIKFNREYDENKLTGLLHIGAQSCDFLIFKSNNLWIRNFAIGGNNFTEAIKKKMNIGFAEAEKVKKGINLDNQDAHTEALKEVLENLQAEISRSIEYYYFQQKQVSSEVGFKRGPEKIQNKEGLEEIILSGGGALLHGLDKFLTNGFSCPVRRLNPFKGLHIGDEVRGELNPEHKLIFSQAVGLGIREFFDEAININLLKAQQKVKTAVRQKMAFNIGSLILSIIILWGVSVFMRQNYLDRNARLRRLQNLLSGFSMYQPQLERLQKEKETSSRQIETLASLTKNRVLWLDVLLELQKILPEDLWITKFAGTISIDDSTQEVINKIDLEGKAGSYNGINQFVSSLKSSPSFIEVKPLSSSFREEILENKEKTELVHFSVSMKLKLKR